MSRALVLLGSNAVPSFEDISNHDLGRNILDQPTGK
jgi:hypothetical protein